jgi:hypothetical protein
MVGSILTCVLSYKLKNLFYDQHSQINTNKKQDLDGCEKLESKFLCEICFNEKEKNETCKLKCGHELCLCCYTHMIYTSTRENTNIGCPFCRADPCDISYSKNSEDDEGTEDDYTEGTEDEYNHGTMYLGEVSGIPNLIDTHYGLYVPMSLTPYTKQEIIEYNEMSLEDTRTTENNKVRYDRKRCMDLIEAIFEECVQINVVMSMLRRQNEDDDYTFGTEGAGDSEDYEEDMSVHSNVTQWTDISSVLSWTNVNKNINNEGNSWYNDWKFDDDKI